MWYHVYFASVLVSAIVASVVAVYAWRHRHVWGAYRFAWFSTVTSGWLWSYVLMLTSPSVTMARFWNEMLLTCIVAVGPTWLAFAVAYVGYQKRLTRRLLLGVSAIPLVSVLLIWTNEAHHWFVESIEFSRVDFLLVPERVFGTWFFAVHTPYGYLAVVGGMLLLVSQAVRSSKLYRLQVVALMVGATAPLIPNVLMTFGLTRLPFTHVGFTIAGIVYGWAIFRYRFLDLVPVARHLLVDTMDDGMLVLDSQDRIVDLNPAMEAILGVEAGSGVVGRQVEGVLPSWPDLAGQLHGGQAETTIERDGASRHYSLRSLPIDHRGEKGGRLIVTHDDTEITRAQEALRERTVELEASNTALEDFSHTVAHSLKSPAFAVVSLTRSVVNGLGRIPVDDTRQDMGDVYLLGVQMLHIIDELLLLAGLRKQKQFATYELDMGELTTRALERLGHEIESQGAEIRLPAEWPVALGHAPWVVEVWVNYVSNALRYGGKPPRIECGATVEESAGTVRFWVQDDGPGIGRAESAKLFSQFERLGQIHVDGCGLGLSIARRIVEKMGGEVGVESEKGRGSRFWFTLASGEKADGAGQRR